MRADSCAASNFTSRSITRTEHKPMPDREVGRELKIEE